MGETKVPLGTDVVIRCETLLAEAEVRWVKDGQLVEPDERRELRSEQQGRQHLLSLTAVRAEDRGEYGVLVEGAYVPVTSLHVDAGRSAEIHNSAAAWVRNCSG